MEAFLGVLSAFGLSASAGLNAYIPLLIVALVSRYTNWIELASPWDHLGNGWVVGAIIFLAIVEFFADKVPAVNHVNDAIQTLIRPAAGAILFAASTGVVTDIHPVIGLIAGLFVAGTVHAAKASVARPAVTMTTAGAGNVPVSIAEDILAAALTVLSIVVPVVIAAVIIVLTAFVVWWLWRRASAAQAAGR